MTIEQVVLALSAIATILLALLIRTMHP